jgi:transposase-like protein
MYAMVCICIIQALLRKTSERLACSIKRNHVSIGNWIQKYHLQKLSYRRRNVSEYVVDETLIKVVSESILLWVIIEPKKTGKFSHQTYPKKETCS